MIDPVAEFLIAQQPPDGYRVARAGGPAAAALASSAESLLDVLGQPTPQWPAVVHAWLDRGPHFVRVVIERGDGGGARYWQAWFPADALPEEPARFDPRLPAHLRPADTERVLAAAGPLGGPTAVPVNPEVDFLAYALALSRAGGPRRTWTTHLAHGETPVAVGLVPDPSVPPPVEEAAPAVTASPATPTPGRPSPLGPTSLTGWGLALVFAALWWFAPPKPVVVPVPTPGTTAVVPPEPTRPQETRPAVNPHAGLVAARGDGREAAGRLGEFLRQEGLPARPAAGAAPARPAVVLAGAPGLAVKTAGLSDDDVRRLLDLLRALEDWHPGP